MPSDLVRTITWHEGERDDAERLLVHEFLVTNGLGGSSSGTIAGACTRKYHGLLVAALPAPLGRVVMLSHLSEQVRLPDGKTHRLGGEESRSSVDLHGARELVHFRLEAGLPIWRYDFGSAAIEKRIFLAHLQNTVYITYRLVSGSGPVRLKLRPSVHFRLHEASVAEPLYGPYSLTAVDGRYEIAGSPVFPPLRLTVHGLRPSFTFEGARIEQVRYRVEERRGYECHGDLYTPGRLALDLAPGRDAALVASTEPWEVVQAMTPEVALEAELRRRAALLSQAPPPARHGLAAELVLGADQFIITPAGRVEDAARARASGEEVRTVIAGYHWFTDWGRDTMISLEGLTLSTGRHVEAGYILDTFAHYVRDGLIPNMFPEGKREGLYHTADATLWFFHALERYIDLTGDRGTLARILPTLLDIVAHHVKGTRFGIGVDPADGLLRQGAPGYQLTWMDAKVDDWVVTPRRGKAVEINALWYNALRLLERWVREERSEADARELGERAGRARESFNRRFWFEEGGYLHDVVDAEKGGDDASFRPNQVFAISLPNPVLDPSRWEQVLGLIQERLLTPMGLRTLAPGSPDYKAKYDGDLRARDAAYHQGTVWAWLIGPFVDAWLKVHPGDIKTARGFLNVDAHLGEACIGSISEVFDAEKPFTARGCVAQAWSVAEVLRAWVKTEPEGK